MVKSYFKYEHSKTFGIVASATSNVVWTADDAVGSNAKTTGAGRAIVGAGEEVLCWDVKKGDLLGRWKDTGCTVEVTVIARSHADPDIFAVGYEDGSIRIWDSRLLTVIISFNGHKSSVTKLSFDKAGVRLASGARDTDIILWDLVAEVGLFKLRGHKNQITGLSFLCLDDKQDSSNTDENSDPEHADESMLNGSHKPDYLLTTGKDSLIKLWDLSAQHCMETHVAQSNGECWALGLFPGGDACITAGNDGELKVWAIDTRILRLASQQISQDSARQYLRVRGTINRQGKDRTLAVQFHPLKNYVAAHGSDKSIEIWRMRSISEVEKSLARKRKRRREKSSKDLQAGKVDEVPDLEDEEVDPAKADISEFIVPYVTIRTNGKVRSIDWTGYRQGKSVRILAATTNNQLEVYDIQSTSQAKSSSSSEVPDYVRAYAVDLPGHRTDIRSLSLSSDDRMLASASNGYLKVWNVRTQSCLRTLECDYALCSSFLPGDKIVIVGNRSGELQVFDIASSSLIETIKAHDGPIWTLNVHPDGKSVVTGSADKCAKFWNFEVIQEEIPGTRRTTPKLTLIHTRTLKVSDDILSIKFSPDSRLLAAALLNNTVKVFFVDSLKLYLNLYGHKLPVLNMDISFDSKLIVTCSADKNIRLWGLDFGDCHKAFFAHQDSIMQVTFVPHNQDGNGHHFFSASKDRTIKYWDGDKFEQIQKLSGHHGEIWAMAISRTGKYLVSASHDKSIRLWEETDEQIFLQEEREKELEELYENTLTTSLEQEEADGDGVEVLDASKQTIETLVAGEKIAEALDIGGQDLAVVKEWRAQKESQPKIAPPQRNIIFMAFGNISAEQYVLSTIEKIKAAALQDALLILTYERVMTLFTFISIWVERQWNIPLTCRILFFMLKTHYRQIIASKTMKPMLDDIRTKLRTALTSQKDEIGFNAAALRVLGSRVQEQGRKEYVDEDTWAKDEEMARLGKKRAFINIA